MGKTFCKLRKWINKEPIPTDFTCMKDFCYAIVSLTTNDWYIGSASNGWQRWKQHIADAKNVWNKEKSNNKKYRMMNIHKCMNRTGIHNWIMIPISNQIVGRKQLEKKLIKKLQPTLNVLWTKKKEKKRNRPALKYRNKLETNTHTETDNTSYKNDTQPPYTTFFIGQTPYADIFKAIKTLGNGTNMEISWTRGDIDASNYLRLKKTYKVLHGETKPIEQNIYTFQSAKQLRQIIKSNRKGTLIIKEVTVSDIITHYTKMALELKKKGGTSDIPNETLWKLFAAKCFIRKRPLRQAIQYQLTRMCKERFGISIPNKIPIRVPYNKTIQLNMIQRMAIGMIQLTKLPVEALEIMKRKVKPVYTRQPSIGDISMNFMKMARSMDTVRYKCVCGHEGSATHTISKIIDIKDKALEPLQFHRKVVPLPDDPGVWTGLFQEFKKLQNMLKKVDHNTNDYNIYKYIQGWIKKAKRTPQKTNCHMSAHATRMAVRKLSGWLIMYADKNPGMLITCCPMWYIIKMNETFKHDGAQDSYTSTKETEETLMKKWCIFHKDNLKNVGPFNKKGGIPYGYILPKFKDLNKTRPIVSYYHHPLKRILNIFARALTFLLKTCTSVRHLTIWNTDALIANIQMQTNGWMEPGKYKYTMISGDIKNMYTMLPPEEMLQAVEWLLQKVMPLQRC